MKKFWQTSRRKLTLEKTLVMAILNVTPDSFSDGGNFLSIDAALRQAEKLIEDGADILDIGGESTRPNGAQISADEEIVRVVPVIEAITKRFDIPVSIDTYKSETAEKAIEAGAEIVNDISGLRFDERLGAAAAKHRAGLILMHLRGSFATMHKQPPAENIMREVAESLWWSIEKAKALGTEERRICLDIGIGFSKTFEQNLELLAKLDKIAVEFPQFPLLVGASRKSFIGKILDGATPDRRLEGSLAAAAIAAFNGANILRVHDVKETVQALKVADAVRMLKNKNE